MILLGLAGKKRSGKNTLCNQIHSHVLNNINVPFETHVNDQGQLVTRSTNGNFGIFNLDTVHRRDAMGNKMLQFLSINVWPWIKQYSFADGLKHIAMDFFGLTWEQCYIGDRSDFTDYYWENMPSVLTTKTCQTVVGRSSNSDNVCNHENGRMTVRDVLQFVGTDVFRKIHNTCWVDYLRTTLQMEWNHIKIGIITDVRFDNEAEMIRELGGKVIKLTRSVDEGDLHASESGLSNHQSDIVLDNKYMSVREQWESFKELGLLPS